MEKAIELKNDDLVQIIMKCVNFAAIKHKEQRRMDSEKTPYINHPIGMEKHKTSYFSCYEQ